MLSRALELEYSLIVNYPRIACEVSDPEIRLLVQQLAAASIHHVGVLAGAIRGLGGTLRWSVELLPQGMSLLEIFQRQLEKEKESLVLHDKAGWQMESLELRQEFAQMAREEQCHVQTVRKIIQRLGPD